MNLEDATHKAQYSIWVADIKRILKPYILVKLSKNNASDKILSKYFRLGYSVKDAAGLIVLNA